MNHLITRLHKVLDIKKLIAVLFVLCLFMPSMAATLVGKGTASKTNKGDLRIVFPLTEKTSFTSFRLENPARLVIDIPQAQLRDKVTALPIKGGNVQGVRLGTQQGTDLRIVVDMSQAMPASTALLKGRQGYELVILVNQNIKDSQPVVIVGKEESIVSAQTEVQVAKTVAKKNILIAIDPGHGGKDPGAVGPRGAREKDIVLAIARQLRDKINRERGMRAVMTRDNDRFIPLRERVLIARRQKADMFISIHADAGSSRADGASVYILSTSGASSEAAKMLAAKENMSDMIGGVKLSDKDDAIASMLLDISQDATIEASHELGKYILNNVQKHARLHKRNVERAGFAVLKAPDIPSVLVETGFISNPNEERKLTTASHQAKIAEDILLGIKAYYRARPATELVYSTVKRAPPATPPVASAPPKVSALPPKAPLSLSAKPQRAQPQNLNDAPGKAGVRLISTDQTMAPIRLSSPQKVTQAPPNTVPKVSSARRHTVARGESLADVARRYNTNEALIKRANNLPLNQLRVPVGTLLIIPK